MTVVLQLGSLTLEGFEVPGRVTLGGSQSLAVHKLPGGVRIIDAMGRDDADLAWSGVLSGPDASGRARLLDTMRVAGTVLPLSWDQFTYSVLVGRLRLAYRNPWWIEYGITCKVLRDEAQADLVTTVSAATAIASDLTAAGIYVDVTAASAATGAAGALTVGTAAAATAANSLSVLKDSVSVGIAGAEGALGSSDLAGAVGLCGTLAQLTYAQGFIGRAMTNLNGYGG